MTVVTSTQVAALNALVTLATAQLPSVLVVDGPYNDNNADQLTAQSRLFVGADTAEPGVEVTAVTGEQTFQNEGSRNRRETYVINCVATAVDPNGSLSTARSLCSTILAGVETLLRGTNTSPNAANLGGTIKYGEVGPTDLLQSNIETGAYVEWRFGIRATSYLNQT